MTDPEQLPRVVLDQSEYTPEPGIPAWARALLRVLAAAWFVLAVWPPFVLQRDQPTDGQWLTTCTAVGTTVVQLLLAICGVVVLLRAAAVRGVHLRRALVVAVALFVVWLFVMTVLAWELPGQRCLSG